MVSMALPLCTSTQMLAPPVVGTLLFAIAVLTVLMLVLLSVAGALVALYGLVPSERSGLEHWLPSRLMSIVRPRSKKDILDDLIRLNNEAAQSYLSELLGSKPGGV